MTAYTHVNDVGLNDCDPSGVVSLPRSCSMIYSVIENWFDEALDWPISQMMGSDNLSLPVVDISTRFVAPSRLGDTLRWRLEVSELGRASMTLSLITLNNGDLRMRSRVVLVLSDMGAMRSRIWPDPIRVRVGEFLAQTPDTVPLERKTPEPVSEQTTDALSARQSG